MHRSGTSMITRALHDSGLHLIGAGAEELIDAAEDNPEGFWENKAIVACNDDLLEAAGGSWDNPPPYPPRAVDDPRVAHVAESATAALAGLSEHAHWGFKDPRTCLTAGYWHDLQPDLGFVICVRHPLEVALSLKRRNQNSYSLGLALWERYYATVCELVPHDRRLVTHYDTFFVDPVGELERLCRFAGLEAAAPRVRTDLRHHTIGVDLGDAGVSRSLGALYADLCREAGAPSAPEPPTDEGRVRRLVLDGAVAARHAEQRQAAIDRLHEREQELRAEAAAAEARHRERIRELEAQVRAARQESLERIDRMLGLETAVARLETTLDQTKTAVTSVEARTRAIGAYLDAGAARRTARAIVGRLPGSVQRGVRRTRRRVHRALDEPGPTAKRAARWLPASTQQSLRRTRRRVRVAVADPERTVTRVFRSAEPGARSAAKRLPAPARAVLRRNRARVERAVADPGRAARHAVRRLPPGVQRGVRATRRVTIRSRTPARGAGLISDRGVAPARVPKGPAPRLWKPAFARLVAESVPDGARWLVVKPGSPRDVRTAVSPRATLFPKSSKGQPLADDLAHVAHLDALRAQGYRYLVLPEGSRPWFRQRAELRDHVVRSALTLADRAGAGAVYDLGAPAAAVEQPTLRAAVDQLLPTAAGAAVLDWTAEDLTGELPGLATFRPPPGAALPYLDASVDVVVTDDERDLAEARRVASSGIVVVRSGAPQPEVRGVERRSPRPSTATRRIAVWSSPAGPGEAWQAELSARAAAAGAELLVGEIDTAAIATLEAYDVAVVLEAHVLPLPGVIEVAAALAGADPRVAVAGRVLRADGTLESAGGTVFSDRSVGLVGCGSSAVRAPWHDYVRAVCWAPGITAAAGSLWAATPAPAALTGRALLREWCAELWARGGKVVYQPGVTAVRVEGDGSEPTVPLSASAWQRVLDLRPARPADLDDAAWRRLLAHDDVEACRG